jgi:hypothetical protein
MSNRPSCGPWRDGAWPAGLGDRPRYFQHRETERGPRGPKLSVRRRKGPQTFANRKRCDNDLNEREDLSA